MERKIVVAIRLGASFPLWFNWYQNSERIGTTAKYTINHGNIYVMSEKATGNDGRRRTIKTLRHAAGYEKNIKIKK